MIGASAVNARLTFLTLVDVRLALLAGVAVGALALVVATGNLDAGTAVGARHERTRLEGVGAPGTDEAGIALAGVIAVFLIEALASIGAGGRVASAAPGLAVTPGVTGRTLTRNIAGVVRGTFATWTEREE